MKTIQRTALKENGRPGYTNYSETLLYYDDEGDGKFETLEEGLDYFARGHSEVGS